MQFEQALGGRPPRYASAPCKSTISSYLFARWWCCSGITISSYLFTRWHLFWHVGYLRHQKQADLWPFDLETVVQVTCDMGYLCANFSFPRPLCSRVGPNVHDRRQTDRRQTKASLNASTLWGRRHNNHVGVYKMCKVVAGSSTKCMWYIFLFYNVQ